MGDDEPVTADHDLPVRAAETEELVETGRMDEVPGIQVEEVPAERVEPAERVDRLTDVRLEQEAEDDEVGEKTVREPLRAQHGELVWVADLDLVEPEEYVLLEYDQSVGLILPDPVDMVEEDAEQATEMEDEEDETVDEAAALQYMVEVEDEVLGGRSRVKICIHEAV